MRGTKAEHRGVVRVTLVGNCEVSKEACGSLGPASRGDTAIVESRTDGFQKHEEASEAEWNKERAGCEGARSRVLGLLQEPWFDSV